MRARRWAWLAFALLLAWPAAWAKPFDVAPARGVVQRLFPARFSALELGSMDGEGERFRIDSRQGHPRVEGTSSSALLAGVNWYLKYVAHGQVSTNGSRFDPSLPLPAHSIERTSTFAWRYALNQNTDGYSSPYWDWPRWEHEIDVLALSGINAMIVERGMDSVLYRTFREFGYSDAAIRGWITQPAHQNWQLMGNLCCFNGPISQALMEKRAASGRRIVARLRELGITPVFPGFYGIVPADFARRFPEAHVVPQGEWAGFTRPGWLDPRDRMFARVASSFYRHQRELFGDSTIYDMEVFQEGGDSGDVPVPEAARAVQGALHAAHPGAAWMMLAWQGNPRADLLAGVDRSRLFIVDIDHDKVPRDNRMHDFQGAPFLFGGIWAFGGRTTLGTNIRNYTERLPRMHAANANMVGTAVFPEGMDSNPLAFDLFTEMAWHEGPVDRQAWAADYARRRYGGDDTHALAAWRTLLDTAYDLQPEGVEFHSERDAGQESLFAAQPSLDANRASNWSPEGMRYDASGFRRALVHLLQVAPALRATPTYRYDLVDVARQVLANESRRLLPEIKRAFLVRDARALRVLEDRWLSLMDLQDKLLATDPNFMLGTWLAHVKGWSSSSAEDTVLHYDARSILTTWGDRKASEGADLHDYGNKDWSGLTRDYYRPRWQAFFATLDASLVTQQPPARIDWFARGDSFNHSKKIYGVEPSGDAHDLARQVDDAVPR
jgi:alpha-N-acetylglucosaminidase (NAGLU)-like protein